MKVSFPHALAVTARNASMYRRTWVLSILPNFFEPVFYLWSIGLGVGAYVSKMRGVPYVEFLVPGLICVSAMNGSSFEATYNVYVRMHYEKMYAAMLTTPVEPEDILVGELLWALVRACMYGGIFLLVSMPFGLTSPLQALRVLPVIPLSGLLFAALGLAFTLRVGSIDLFSYYFTLFLTPLFLFSDVFFPIEERLSGVWLQIAEVLPLLHPVRLARAAFHGGQVGSAGLGTVLWDVAYTLGLSFALLAWCRKLIRERLLS
ncbi:MAG TPA: ABC transporter permease [Polyangiales bacterium]|jgi:lipooligosaccharide transport system permease protein|nr:ABC transporter permease [Polyangiales bacterium]